MICYILYSEKLSKFYIGSSRKSITTRLEEHLEEFYGSTVFTSKAKDWSIWLIIPCHSYEQALAIEKHIKRMKSSKYIRNLKQYPEIIQKLLDKYGSGSLPR